LLTRINVSRLVKVLHLFFVDDILIMSKASLEEWEKNWDILLVFSRASDLVINVQKSVFKYAGVDHVFLQSLKDILYFSCKDLAEGFNYLGYLMNPDSYKSSDWQWLIDRFESGINHWCNKWLSLGGRFILIKVVLESLPVYWLTLAHFSLEALNKLRKLIFSFLWKGNKNKNGYHLCSWISISRPNLYGGWGLWNILCFIGP